MLDQYEIHDNDNIIFDQQLNDFLISGDILIIAGGDGTVHMIVNALYRTGRFEDNAVLLTIELTQ